MAELKLIKAIYGDMFKRYEYWSSENGKPVKKWTKFFEWDSTLRDQWQLKNKLKNEYKP
jgi:hypothetical protein